MIALSPRQLIAAADSLAGVRDAAGAATFRSFAEGVRRRAGMRGAGPWDVALIHHWGFWSQFDHATGTSRWPLLPAATAEELASFAAERNVLREEPVDGDVSLQYSPRRRAFVRSGVVAHVYGDGPAGAEYWDVLAIEGNSGECGELGGNGTSRIVRRLSAATGDRFVRWTALEAGSRAAQADI